jgi:hypothetical protein
MTDRTGACLCGAVRYAVTGGRDDFGICHCKACQRWTGGMFPGIVCQAGQVRVSGGENVVAYRSSAGATRSFCRVCGSTLWFRNEAEGVEAPYYEIAVGTLDQTEGLTLTHEVFVDRKPDAWALVGEHVRDTEADYFRKVAARAGGAS